MATLVSVTYEGGDSVEASVKPMHLARAEQAIKGSAADNQFSLMLRATWEALNRPSDYKVWEERVDDLTVSDPETSAPSPEAPSPGA